jgi:hypothetical protein
MAAIVGSQALDDFMQHTQPSQFSDFFSQSQPDWFSQSQQDWLSQSQSQAQPQTSQAEDEPSQRQPPPHPNLREATVAGGKPRAMHARKHAFDAAQHPPRAIFSM